MEFLPQEIIRNKRDGHELTFEQIRTFIDGLTDGTVSEAQAAAFAMAVFFRSMTEKETYALTHTMKMSGQTLTWKDMNGPVVDKHSTGGVGDKVSLMLAPICAACDCYVPMISGRGLGHTGGTLDKLNAIPGYNVFPDIPVFMKNVKKIGCAIIGQTPAMAPADRILYAVRDVTATVESVPLITASILSKKLCAGLDALTMDIKLGNGAFMTSLKEAKILGRLIKTTSEKNGVKTGVIITDMNEVLGESAGNAVEILESIRFLKNNQEPRLKEVTYKLCANMLLLTGICQTEGDALSSINAAVESGNALEKYSKMIEMNGGPVDFCDDPEKYLPKAQVVLPIPAKTGGYVSRQDTRRIGLAIVALGGGRIHTSDTINYSVGFTGIKSIGTYIEEGEPLAFVHAATSTDAEKAVVTFLSAVDISKIKPVVTSPIVDTL